MSHIATVPQHLFELRSNSNYGGSNYGASTVYVFLQNDMTRTNDRPLS